MITAIKIWKRFKTDLEVASKYYKLLNILNDLGLSPLEIKILSYSAINGNILKGGAREKCAEISDSTTVSVSKSVAKLIRYGFLIKTKGKAVVNPQLLIDFNNSILLKLNIGSE